MSSHFNYYLYLSNQDQPVMIIAPHSVKCLVPHAFVPFLLTSFSFFHLSTHTNIRPYIHINNLKIHEAIKISS